TAAGSVVTGGVWATDVSWASAATGCRSSLTAAIGLVGSGADAAAAADCPADTSAPELSLSENILRPPKGVQPCSGDIFPGNLPNHGIDARKEGGFPPRGRTEPMIRVHCGLCQSNEGDSA